MIDSDEWMDGITRCSGLCAVLRNQAFRILPCIWFILVSFICNFVEFGLFMVGFRIFLKHFLCHNINFMSIHKTYLLLSSFRSSISPWEPHLHCEWDLCHPGVVASPRYRGPRRHHVQPSLQEVLRRWQEVHSMREQCPFCAQAVWPLISYGAGHRPAARLQLQFHHREPEWSFWLESHTQRNGDHQCHHITDRWENHELQ